MSQTPNVMVKVVIGVLLGAMAMYAISLSLPNERLSFSIRSAPTVESLRRSIATHDRELMAEYVSLTQLYLSQGNISQALTLINEGSIRFPNNLDILRLQADIQSSY